jgi:hypothetical protein
MDEYWRWGGVAPLVQGQHEMSAIGADFNPKRHRSFHGTFNPAHFNHDDLHDELQWKFRAFPIVMHREP